MGIGETLRQALAKLFMRAAGYQAKTACVNLQLCAGLEASIEGATHAVGKRRLDRARQRSRSEEARIPKEDEDEDEAEGEYRLMIETEETEEDVAEILEEELGVEVEEEGEGEEGGDETLRSLGALEFLTQE